MWFNFPYINRSFLKQNLFCQAKHPLSHVEKVLSGFSFSEIKFHFPRNEAHYLPAFCLSLTELYDMIDPLKSIQSSVMIPMNKLSLPILFLFFLLISTITACVPEGDEEQVLDQQPTLQSEAPEFFIPESISEGGEPKFENDNLFLKDYSNFLHAVQIMATVSRDSEYGNEAYRPDLYTDGMSRNAELFLDLIAMIDYYFNDNGKFAPRLEPSGEGFEAVGDPDLSIYPHLVYAYHIHHRSGRFDYDPTLYERLNREATNYLVSPGRYLMDELYQDGTFQDFDGTTGIRSMSYGLGGLHGHAYSWIVWKKPGGEDTMGVLPQSSLEHFMGYSPESMTDSYRELARTLDEAWDDQRSIYDFGEDTTWPLDAVGALIRGKKAMYDMLWMFGDEEDREMARTVFDRTAAIFESAAGLAEPWGIPEEIEFTADGAVAVSDVVNLNSWYQFLNHMGGGYGFDREREGTAMFISNYREDLFDLIGELSDNALLGSLEYHLNSEGRLMASVNYSDGSPADERTTVSTTGMFIATAGNIYRKGDSFERASDWDSVSDEVATRSRVLYDLKFDHFELMLEAMNE